MTVNTCLVFTSLNKILISALDSFVNSGSAVNEIQDCADHRSIERFNPFSYSGMKNRTWWGVRYSM